MTRKLFIATGIFVCLALLGVVSLFIYVLDLFDTYFFTELLGLVALTSFLLSGISFVVWLIFFAGQRDAKKRKVRSFCLIIFSAFLLIGSIAVFYSGTTTSMPTSRAVIEEVDGRNYLVWQNEMIPLSPRQYERITENKNVTFEILRFDLINYTTIGSFRDSNGYRIR